MLYCQSNILKVWDRALSRMIPHLRLCSLCFLLPVRPSHLVNKIYIETLLQRMKKSNSQRVLRERSISAVCVAKFWTVKRTNELEFSFSSRTRLLIMSRRYFLTMIICSLYYHLQGLNVNDIITNTVA